MKVLFYFLTFMMMAATSFAGYRQCPRDWYRYNNFTHALLLRMQGVHKIGDCKLELRVCNPALPSSEDSQVGDALITYNGQEYYVPLYTEQRVTGTSSTLTSGQREVIFKFIDENSDPLAGHHEQDRLALRLNHQKTKMVALNLRRKNDYQFSQFIFWKLPTRLHCEEP